MAWGIWFLDIFGLCCAIAAIVLVFVKPECNLAIFILALVAIIFCLIGLIWTIYVAIVCGGRDDTDTDHNVTTITMDR